ncbi:RIP metalloprotease RseP [Actimicrobium sp. CCI2.3]|uniref:RIP metalloprotease RseP n=1 Tax=Actimicrobium sp. CCI2.3 TaxID=3048616 RepID=UPI002AB3D81F|nr:RIP metalloprotease RseP [Actimicrobium sp. CCI2.3]MDY7572801.1 RIP metalloprotease RseP [Actimicrobium sp. CCI2.3]MEB0020646.1 RIP metalloprotease RseP [Actimicrobium sp. CCI2.3]
MSFLQTLLAFMVALGSLVIIHELGHYSVARLCGVKVLRFSVGMGKVIYSRKFGPDQTEWAVSILPLGGYVKMLDKREQPDVQLSAEDLKREFTNQSVWRRIAIVAAGPAANFLMAILIFAGLYVYGVPEPAARLRAPAEQTVAFQAGVRGGELVTAINGKPVQGWSDLRWQLVQLSIEKTSAKLELERANAGPSGGKRFSTATIPSSALGADDLEGDFVGKLGLALARSQATLGHVESGGAGQQAGLQPGDRILAADGKAIADGDAFVNLVRASPAMALNLTLLRAGEQLSVNVTPASIVRDGKAIGQIKVEIASGIEMVTLRAAPLQAVSQAVVRTWDSAILQLKMLGKVITGEASIKNISGPITIADYAGQTARIGLITYLGFIAAISIGLGVMNLLPIPVLDGGLLMYYSVEVLTGRPVSERVGQLGQRLGIGLLMTLMMVAVFNDIVRLVS